MHYAGGLTGRRRRNFDAASSGLCSMVPCRADKGDRRFRVGLPRLSVQMNEMMLGAKICKAELRLDRQTRYSMWIRQRTEKECGSWGLR